MLQLLALDMLPWRCNPALKNTRPRQLHHEHDIFMDLNICFSPVPRYAKGFIRNKPGVATAVVSGLDSGVAYFWKAFPAAGTEWDTVMMAGGGFRVQWVYPYVCTNGAIEWISFGWWLILS